MNFFNNIKVRTSNYFVGNRQNSWLHLICLLILFIYFLPYIIWGQDCLIRIGDNLDGNIPYYKLIAHNAHTLGWNSPIVPQIMNGLPKASFLTDWNLTYLLFYIFPAFRAYIIHLVLIALIAFYGMLFLLKTHVIKNQDINNTIITYGIALCFSLLPYYPSAGISIAGLPVLLLVFLNINNGNIKLWNYIIIFLFPFYSSIIFIGVFLFIILSFWGLYKIFSNRDNLRFYILACFLLLISYLITEHTLLLNYLSDRGADTIVSVQGIATTTFYESLIKTVRLLYLGLPSHANIYQFPVMLLSIAAAFIILFLRNNKNKPAILFLSLLILIFALIAGFYNWEGFNQIKNHFPLLKTFDFSRFSFLLPVLFYLLFGYSLITINHFAKRVKLLIAIVLILQVGFIFKRNSNNKMLYYKFHELIAYNRTTTQELTYREFYSENLFSQVKDFIGQNTANYRVICLGIEPAILLYNGFYTLDGYNSNYPVEYKKNFRAIIEKEIDKSEAIRKDFDVEGSYCYLYSAELTRGYRYVKSDTTVVNNLEINADQIKNMGGHYIVSGVEIKNYEQNKLSLIQSFEDSVSPYKIYLYEPV